MPGPHPVVGLPTVVANGRRRGIYDADILKHLMNIKYILPAVIHLRHRSFNILFAFFDGIGHLYGFFGDLFIFFCRIADPFSRIEDLCCYIFHFGKKSCLISRSFDLIAAFGCKKTVDQVIAVDAGSSLEGRKGYMVIGDK